MQILALLALLLASAGALPPGSAGDGTAVNGVSCPPPPQPPVVTPVPVSTPCSPLPLANNNNNVAAEGDLVSLPPTPATVSASVATDGTQPTPTTTDFSCTPVSVKGDAMYCISGRVCSGEGSSLPGTNCPKKGDIAISRCVSNLRTYDAATGNCVAQQDAQCVVIETGVWGCDFPKLVAESLSLSSGLTTPLPLEIVSVVPANTISVSVASVPENTDVYLTATVFTANTPPPETRAAKLSTPALNGTVAVAALVVAAFGVALARNHRRESRASRANSTRNLGRLEDLTTPI